MRWYSEIRAGGLAAMLASGVGALRAGPPIVQELAQTAARQVVVGDGPDGKPMPITVATFRPAPTAVPGIDFAALAAEADLVFRGTVTGIDYALSEPLDGEAGQVPFTLVTYAVSEVFLGEVAAESLTLRFIGGLNETTLRYLVRRDSPQFDVGDEDVLFVRGNGELACPLVDDAGGRIRLIAGRAFTDAGRAILRDADGALRAGPRYRLAEVDATLVGGMVMMIQPRPVQARREGPADAVSTDALTEQLRAALATLDPACCFQDVDAAAPIAHPDAEPLPGP